MVNRLAVTKLLSCTMLVTLLCGVASAGESDPFPTSGPGADAALEVLRQINHNPAVSHSIEARNEALLTTGSVVKSNGTDRVLYHLPATGQGMQLDGESDSKEWPLYIAREQLSGKVSLHLGYVNAVSVMPEASYLAVEINGVMIGKHAIQSPDRTRVLTINIPTNILVPGHNSVRVSARQRHRVDCSIKATHELWTRIDPAKTGVVYSSGNSVLKSLGSVAALARNKAGQVKMRLLAPHANDREQVQRLMLMGQEAAIYAEFENPQVEVASVPGQGPGLDIYTGSLNDLRRIAPEYASAIRNNNSLQILSSDGKERLALILITGEVTSDKNFDRFKTIMSSMFPKKSKLGSRQGLAAVNRLGNKVITEGEKVSFSRLGLPSEEFDGHLYRRSMQVNLPSDYFAADYNQAEMHLAIGYAAGLNQNNKFIVRVNGVTATGFALSKFNGHVFQNKMLRLPLSSFKPGVNQIELEAQLANASDKSCDPVAQITGTKRFVMSGKSYIQFPRLAHLARLPDLSGTISAGFPYMVEGVAQPTVISVPSGGYTELSAAAGFTTRLAIKSGQALDFKLRYTAPTPDTANAIIIGTFEKLPREIAESIEGIDRSVFQTAWHQQTQQIKAQRVALLELQNVDGVDTMTTASIAKADVPAPAFTRSRTVSALDRFSQQAQNDPLDRWAQGEQKPTEREDDRLSFSGHVSALFATVLNINSKAKQNTPVITNPKSDVLITQRMSFTDEPGVWTILTAPTEQALKSGMSMMANPEIAGLITGETATINGVDRTVTSAISSQNYIQMRGFSFRNLHLVVAGWFSNNHHIYSLMLLLGLLGFGFLSTRVLATVGVDRKKAEGREND